MVERWLGYTDDPIAEDAHDLLDRARFARRIATVLDDVREDSESGVLSLVGPWGSGKTSLLTMVRDAMPEPWRVVSFNPWATAGTASLIGDFFETIGSALPRKPAARRATEALRRYSQKVSPLLGAVPVAGPALTAASETAERAFGSDTIEEQAEEVAARLRDIGVPVLLVIDDVDRLQPEELTALFKAVRLLGRLPMVYYMLSYDQRTVLDLLDQTDIVGGDRSRGLAYLEKIVQYPLDLPPILPLHLRRMFMTGLAKLLDHLGSGLTPRQWERMAEAWQALLSQVLTQPRAVQRYLARLTTYLPLADPAEVDVVDFAILALVQQHFPGVYQELATSREHVTYRFTPSWEPGEGSPPHRARSLTAPRANPSTLASINAEAGGQPWLADGLRSVLQQIFELPAPDDGDDGTATWEATQQAYRERRAALWDYFPRYFTFGVTETDVADRVVAEGLRAIGAGTDTPARQAVERAIGGSKRGKLHALSGDLRGRDAYVLLRHIRQNLAPGSVFGNPDHFAHHLWIQDLLVQSRGGPSPAAVVRDLVGDGPEGTEELTELAKLEARDLLHLHWLLDHHDTDDAGREWLDSLRRPLARHLLGVTRRPTIDRALADARWRYEVFAVVRDLTTCLSGSEAFPLLRHVVRHHLADEDLQHRQLAREWAHELLARSIDRGPSAEAIVRRLLDEGFDRGVEFLHGAIARITLPMRARLRICLARAVLREVESRSVEDLRRLRVAAIVEHGLRAGGDELRTEVVESIAAGRLSLLDLATHFVDHKSRKGGGADYLATSLYDVGDAGGVQELWHVVRREAEVHGLSVQYPDAAPGLRAEALAHIMRIGGLRRARAAEAAEAAEAARAARAADAEETERLEHVEQAGAAPSAAD
jgi:KAP-like P-loop domain-containing protein